MAELDERLQVILTNIMTIMINSSIEEPFFIAVLQRLESFGYTVQENDVSMICFTSERVKNNIRNSCNITTIPEDLVYLAVDMVCGEFLFTKKATGQLSGFDFGSAVKSIQEGDTNVTFIDGMSAEQQFDSFVDALRSVDRNQFVSYRKLLW